MISWLDSWNGGGETRTPNIRSQFAVLKHVSVVKHPLSFFFADSIEANVESSEVHVERATDQLQQAAYYQVKAGTKKSHSVLQTLWAIRVH